MADAPQLVANVLPVEFRPAAFEVWTRPFGDTEELRALRDASAPHQSVWIEGGVVHFVPLGVVDDVPSGTERVELKVADNLRMVARLTTEALLRRFPAYEPIRRKPFVFLGRKRQLMHDAAEVLRVSHPLLDDFRIWPRYSLDARIIEVHDDEPFVGITVELATRWEIVADLDALERADVDLTGLYVVRRDRHPDERPLVGRIARIAADCVELSESTTDRTSMAIADVMLEGRKEAFARCLRQLLGVNYQRYDELRDRRTGELLGGPPLLEEVRRVATILGGRPLQVSRDLTCVVGEPMPIGNTDDYKSIVPARQLDYCFDAARTKRNPYAWPGLSRYGPFSRDTFARPTPRILVVFPQATQGAVEKFVRYLRDGIPGQPHFQAGFAKTFGLINPRFDLLAVPPSHRTAENYRRVIHDSLAHGDLPDAAIVIVTDRDGDLPDPENPYLHSKAVLLMAGVATQHARLSKITASPGSLQYILQNISIALYAKLKGVPWTVDQDLTIADELVIGIGSVELSDSRIEERHRYVGITTVFRGDGNYLLGQLSREATYAEYPNVLRDSVRDTIEEIKARNGWQPGDTVRIVLHAARPPTNVDFALLMREAVRAAGRDQHIEFAFLTVSHDHPFMLFDPTQRGKPTQRGAKGAHAPERGLIVQTGRYSRLVTTTGVTLVKRAELPLPKPLQVHLHRHSTFTDLHYLSEQVLKFTSLSWRSTHPSADPVTIYYSELIARHLARLRAVPDWSPALLDARLRTSKWFL